MKLNELRIGNLINYEQTTHIITSISSNGELKSRWLKQPEVEVDYTHSIEDTKPIEVTPEMLRMMGFVDRCDTGIWWELNIELPEGYLYPSGYRKIHYEIKSGTLGLVEKPGGDMTIKEANDFLVETGEEDDVIGHHINIEHTIWMIDQIKYIHTLQNVLYFFTGKDIRP